MQQTYFLMLYLVLPFFSPFNCSVWGAYCFSHQDVETDLYGQVEDNKEDEIYEDLMSIRRRGSVQPVVRTHSVTVLYSQQRCWRCESNHKLNLVCDNVLCLSISVHTKLAMCNKGVSGDNLLTKLSQYFAFMVSIHTPRLHRTYSSSAITA